MPISLRQLEAFVAVCNEGNFSKAAQRIHISQSGLSILVRELEQSLDCRLFDRSTRQVSLTEAGREFRGPAARLLADLSTAVGNVRGLASRQHGHVTVAAPPLLMSRLVIGMAARFRQAYPHIALTLRDIPSEAIPAGIAGAEIDLGIGALPEDHGEYLVEPLLEGPLMALLPAAHPLARRRSLKWADIAGVPLVTLTPENTFRLSLDRSFARLGLQPDIAVEAAQLGTVISLVEAGFGAAVLPPYGALLPGGGSAVARRLEEPEVRSEIVMIRDRFRSPSAAAESFIEVARAMSAQLADRLPEGTPRRRASPRGSFVRRAAAG
ncbi:HTH-type transcriptional regulator CynR [Pigmentiphaga humi]|uniref:HTH-type transcriptional regulator CynR n=1 Tax=Pigmentiphaga humi TaxID=2478468 RepID=A0A3P4AYL7_9BURK|nr:LysR family transcriptional regulator [Pigmentiphaga humi]VCU68518.1 HTH-type transcriptional regulator CynR [Pigmentiphaga humi]